jgi:predicted anti-sigma-YlaC factor YlaD
MQWLSLDLDGELGDVERAGLERHLERCERCRARRTDISAFTLILRTEPPIGPAKSIPVSMSGRPRLVRRAAVTGAAAALAAAVAFVGIPHSGSGPSGALDFGTAQQQLRFAEDHTVIEPDPAATGLLSNPIADRALD